MYLTDVGLNQQSVVVGGLAPPSVAPFVKLLDPTPWSMFVFSVLRHCALDT